MGEKRTLRHQLRSGEAIAHPVSSPLTDSAVTMGSIDQGRREGSGLQFSEHGTLFATAPRSSCNTPLTTIRITESDVRDGLTVSGQPVPSWLEVTPILRCYIDRIPYRFTYVRFPRAKTVGRNIQSLRCSVYSTANSFLLPR
jgi:hypothetical protein